MTTKPVGYLVETHGMRSGWPGVFYNYVLAGNGLFVQAQNKHFSASVCIAPAEVRGLDHLQEYMEMRHGRIPFHELELALSIMSVNPGVEQYLAFIWDECGYRLQIPPQTRLANSVDYEVPEGAVMDIHSHTGDMPAKFSGIDFHDEQGFKLYAVAAGFDNLCPTVEIRLGLYGYYLPLEKEDVFA